MKSRSRKKQTKEHRLSFDTIGRAKELDMAATMTVLEFYKSYMLELCKIELYDSDGNQYICYDEDLYQELQFKLIKEIRNRFVLR